MTLTLQAVRAVETLNGTDLGGRKILVREDREDKDVKNYNRCACLLLEVLACPQTAGLQHIAIGSSIVHPSLTRLLT